jgi:hypothetical protein
MKNPTENVLDDIESLNERVSLLFGTTDSGIGFGRGYRQILAHAENHALHFDRQTAQSMLWVVDELLTIMENAEMRAATMEDGDA